MWKTLSKQHGQTALYQQVVEQIEQAIESGLLVGGERLPSERRLCALLGVNRSTIIHALDNLSDRGVLMRKRGSGTYVNDAKWGLQQYPILNWQPPAATCKPRGLAEYKERIGAEREKAMSSGKPLWDLSLGDLPGELLPAMDLPERSWQEVMRQELDEESSLTGLAAFKETVRHHLQTALNLKVSNDEILITSGARQALFLISQCLLRPGDAVGIEEPSYFYSLPIFQAAGLRLFAIPTDNEGIDPGGLEAVASRRGLKMIFINPIFQNPTGHIMSARRKEAVLHFCSSHHIPIVEDDAYSLLAGDEKEDVSPLKALDQHGQALYIGSLSSYMGHNIRAGWLVAPRNIVRRLAAVRQQIDAGLSVLPQLLAGHYLRQSAGDHIHFLRGELLRRANTLLSKLELGLPAYFSYERPKGGFYLYLRTQKNMWDEQGDPLDALLDLGIIPARGVDFGDVEGTFRLNYAYLGCF